MYYTMRISKLKTFGLATLLFMVVHAVSAQPGAGRRMEDRIQALESRRIAYITSSLSLTPQEAKQFWPIYNEYLKKSEELSLTNRAWHRPGVSAESLTEEQAAQIAENEILRMEEAARLRREYHEKFKEVLPIKKIALLYEAERNFNRTLLRETQHRMRGR